MDICLTYYYYTFNQAQIGTNPTTVLLQVSVGTPDCAASVKTLPVDKTVSFISTVLLFYDLTDANCSQCQMILFLYVFVLCLLMKKKGKIGKFIVFSVQIYNFRIVLTVVFFFF